MSGIAAGLQSYISRRREETGLYREIAEKLALGFDTGRLLDVGTGSGLLLKAIDGVRPGIELYGLDVSGPAIRVAERNLEGIGGKVDLRVGSIESTMYEDGFFDVVTCTASFSYWDDPVKCFDEIYRILKPGCSAVLFEPQEDINMDEVMAAIDETLADASPLRRFAARSLHRYGLRWGRRIGLRLYSVEEIEELVGSSCFKGSGTVERIRIMNLPIWVRITLEKPVKRPS